MKAVAVFCFIFVSFVVSCHGLPVELEDVDLGQTGDSSQGLVRVKRVTCDVLNFEIKGFKLNDAACAAHCLTLGKRGGWCDGHRVCNCRK
uniref:Putative antimicrobial peptide defensin n=1 Tax=Phaedon cochleariae TaxID=80249 RepID=A0A0U2SUT5_PHACE|nr:putative antimicrobial peptide defensin [Phaedon cochleariae]